MEEARTKIENHIVRAESREEHAEVHTPFPIIERMVSELPITDPEATFLDPCSGISNFPVVVAERLIENGISYEHAMENQIFMVEIQPRNCIMIEKLLNPTGELDLNLKCCDALELDYGGMEPEDFKTERFRTDYGPHNKFFEREVEDEERERLEDTLRLCESKDMRERFAKGYDLQRNFTEQGF